ncbi:HMG-box domain-containing protein [Bdellovibrio svalbardensis]|uniref:Secreted protein n=1 Tax=Bdellovibrio svalbardensis TaxID=2972972 RepID=A0ABT6DMC7_9BACT|nr:hypothetical protein [Bdellovibrio svalbardensis]MDG0816288.1 hypothetical protein [Bdellovibrio svalbardensis]
MRILLALFVTVFGLSAGADGGSSKRVLLQPLSPSTLSAGKLSYSFQLFDDENKKNILEQDLTESHTKKLHFIVYDAALKEFSHVHPEFDGQKWNTELVLPVNGNYFLWAQGKLEDGTDFSSLTQAQVVGGAEAWPITSVGDFRKGTDRETTVEISSSKLRAGKMAMLNYKVTREDGLSPVITPYLGANAHVIAVSPDGDEMVHVHPMDGSSPDMGMLHTTFPVPGDYRIWIQLIDRNEIKTIPLSVTVVK